MFSIDTIKGMKMQGVEWRKIFMKHISNKVLVFRILRELQLNNKMTDWYQKMGQGIPWWCSGLKIWCCHCCGSGHSSSAGLIPGPGTSLCYGNRWKTKTKLKTTTH